MTNLIEYNGILVTHPEGAGRNPGECDIFVGYQHGDKNKPIMSIRYMTLEGNMICMNLRMKGEVTDIRKQQILANRIAQQEKDRQDNIRVDMLKNAWNLTYTK